VEESSGVCSDLGALKGAVIGLVIRTYFPPAVGYRIKILLDTEQSRFIMKLLPGAYSL